MLSLWIFSQLMLIGILQTVDALYPEEGPSISLAEQGEIPYMVLLYITLDEETYDLCAGAIIDPTHILTAAHCTFQSLKEDMAVLAGVVYQQHNGGEHSRVTTIHLPKELSDARHRFETWYKNQVETPDVSQYNKHEINCSFIGNDIAVLTLSRALPFGNNIQAVNLPDSDYSPYCQFCKMSGWGRNEEDGPSADRLHWVYLMILKIRMPQINNSTEFVAIDPMMETCPLQGDSGAPLVFNNTVYGIHTRSLREPHLPSIFSKVFAHMNFIRKALGN